MRKNNSVNVAIIAVVLIAQNLFAFVANSIMQEDFLCLSARAEEMPSEDTFVSADADEKDVEPIEEPANANSKSAEEEDDDESEEEKEHADDEGEEE